MEQKGLTATVHYRHASEKHRHELVRTIRGCMGLYGTTFGLRSGNKALEIHPRLDWNKGTAVNWVRDRLNLNGAGCVCLGDDRTDESMFRECEDATTIAVGEPRRTSAEYLVRDHLAVLTLLAEIERLMRLRTDIAGDSGLAEHRLAVGP